MASVVSADTSPQSHELFAIEGPIGAHPIITKLVKTNEPSHNILFGVLLFKLSITSNPPTILKKTLSLKLHTNTDFKYNPSYVSHVQPCDNHMNQTTIISQTTIQQIYCKPTNTPPFWFATSRISVAYLSPIPQLKPIP